MVLVAVSGRRDSLPFGRMVGFRISPTTLEIMRATGKSAAWPPMNDFHQAECRIPGKTSGWHSFNHGWATRNWLRLLAHCLVVAATLWLSGCATHTDSLEHRERVLYYDRNGDGIVDLEVHRFPGAGDADWELRDDNFSGRYNRKVLYGFTVREEDVDLPVPVHVTIQPNR